MRLIVNGDDFGASEEVNEAIVRAHREGVLTSCSLMVSAPGFEHAVRLARENPGLAVGIHLVTVVGRSVLPRAEIPSLVDAAGNFPNNPAPTGIRYYFSPRSRRELCKELAAQFELFHSTGLKMSHIDGHLHLHCHPVIFRAAVELGKRYGVRRMRIPVEELKLALRYDRSGRLLKTVYALLFRGLGAYMRAKLRRAGFVSAERVYGNLQSGRMDERYFLYTLQNLRAPTNEIYFHPGLYVDSDVLTGDQRQGLIEFRALVSKAVMEQVRQRQIQLVNYHELE